MKSKIYFITGVCGVGKSAVIPYLKPLFNRNDYDIHDFDERGVPSGADRQWRIKETEYWIELGRENIGNNISTIVCGFFNPKEAIHDNKDYIKFIFLDADSEIIEQRISGRYQTEKSRQELRRSTGKNVKKFIEDNVDFLEILRNICKDDRRCSIIDTTDKSPQEVAKRITRVIK